jgi:hypothetical protein
VQLDDVQEPDGVQEVEMEVDGGPEVNAGQEVELEVDAGPEMNSVQELVDGRQGLIAAWGWR